MESPRRTGPRIVALALALFVIGTNAFVLAGVLPDIAVSLDVTPTTVGYAITVYAIIVAVLAPVISVTCAHLRPERVMAAGLLFFALGTGISAVAPGFGVFVIGRAIAAVGGASLVPLATATAPRLARPGRQARAMAAVGLGFTLSIAFGSPLGTAMAELTGWRLPIGLLALAGAVLAVVVAVLLRGVDRGPVVSLGQRLGVLGDWPIVAMLIVSTLIILAFNLVYIFSSAVTAGVTGGDGTVLASLLLIFGVCGVAGNLIGGWLTDAFGNRPTMVVMLSVEALAFLLLLATRDSYLGTAIAFALWGVSGMAATVAVQHRLVMLRPLLSGITLSWYSTAMYLGISLAPVVGGVVLAWGWRGIVLGGAAAALIAMVLSLQKHRTGAG
ncbi:MFS transporter [Brevibacterium daeguense]|uniref:MFS transporter n=1 Tax=Brevibacterium daeguense TaxID=909936 RepID=A0ABP8EIG3_9MICO